MQIDREALLRHYGTLMDGELLALNRDELTEVAQACYDEEVERRGLFEAAGEAGPEAESEEYYDEAGDEEIPPMVQGEEPEWLPDAGCACSFTSYPGGSAATEASEACETLLMAGLPCYLATTQEEAQEGAPPRYIYSVMVPGAMNLHAASVLDRDLFNPRMEEEWRAHFEALSDEELTELTPDVICAGLQDRIERLTRVHAEEVARRRQ
ncbi:MAG TPA: hypothetical protein VNH18_27275 [Bryobacteraceae bacterium]|nr:hypothetical protein [Bryobacteraceae bacterium]